MSDEKNQIFSNGWGTRIITSALGLLLASAVGTSFAMYRQLGQVTTKLDSLTERIQRIDNRVRRLEHERWEAERTRQEENVDD